MVGLGGVCFPLSAACSAFVLLGPEKCSIRKEGGGGVATGSRDRITRASFSSGTPVLTYLLIYWVHVASSLIFISRSVAAGIVLF